MSFLRNISYKLEIFSNFLIKTITNKQIGMKFIYFDLDRGDCTMSTEDISVRTLLQGVKHKPLMKDEEQKHLKLARKGNSESRDLLIEANQRFVVRMAQRYRNQGISLADLIQDGNLGLIEAIDRYDNRRRCRLISYAAWWIRLYMQRAVEQKSRTVNIPINKITSLKKIRDFEYGFIKQNGRKPYYSEIAKAIGLSEEKVAYIYHLGTSSISLHAEDEDGQSMEHRLEFDIREDLMDYLYESQLLDRVEKAMMKLTPREQDVIRCRFGLNYQSEQHSLRQAGQELGLSAEGVRQIQAQAFKKLSDPAQNSNLHSYLSV